VFSSVQNNAGTLTYPTLLAMLQDRPTQFQAAPAPVPLNFHTTQAAWYFQDEIKLRPNLTVRLGVRDEMTTGWNEINGRAEPRLRAEALRTQSARLHTVSGATLTSEASLASPSLDSLSANSPSLPSQEDVPASAPVAAHASPSDSQTASRPHALRPPIGAAGSGEACDAPSGRGW